MCFYVHLPAWRRTAAAWARRTKFCSKPLNSMKNGMLHCNPIPASAVTACTTKALSGTKKAEMQVRVSYQQPGRKEFQIVRESGDGLLRNKVLRKLLQTEVEAATEANRRKSSINKENYKFQFLGSTSDKGTNYYVFSIKPRRKEKYLIEGKIWIDSEHFAIARLEGKPAKKPSFWTSKVTIHHEYADINGFWLPVRNETNSRTRLGGHSELVIDYGRYTDVSGRGSGRDTSPGRSE
jgi:hypothetical protein